MAVCVCVRDDTLWATLLLLFMSLVQQNADIFALTVILLHPPQGLRVSSDQSESCCGLKWSASKQKSKQTFFFVFLICSTGFGRQLEEAPADETKCSFCCLRRGDYSTGWPDWWVTNHERWKVFESVRDQRALLLLRCLVSSFIHHIQMYSTAFLLRTKTLLLQPSLTLISSRIQTQSHQTNRDELHICSNTLAVLFSRPDAELSTAREPRLNPK